MANIALLSVPNNGKAITDKLNEIIDWLNGTTDADRVTDITVSGTKLVVTYINGESDEINLWDTSYEVATTSTDGLMSINNLCEIGSLTKQVTALNIACAAIENANDYISSHSSDDDDDSGGSEGGDGGEGGDW